MQDIFFKLLYVSFWINSQVFPEPDSTLRPPQVIPESGMVILLHRVCPLSRHKPLVTNMTLCLSSGPSEFYLSLYTHLQPIAFLPKSKSLISIYVIHFFLHWLLPFNIITSFIKWARFTPIRDPSQKCIIYLISLDTWSLLKSPWSSWMTSLFFSNQHLIWLYMLDSLLIPFEQQTQFQIVIYWTKLYNEIWTT